MILRPIFQKPMAKFFFSLNGFLCVVYFSWWDENILPRTKSKKENFFLSFQSLLNAQNFLSSSVFTNNKPKCVLKMINLLVQYFMLKAEKHEWLMENFTDLMNFLYSLVSTRASKFLPWVAEILTCYEKQAILAVLKIAHLILFQISDIFQFVIKLRLFFPSCLLAIIKLNQKA